MQLFQPDIRLEEGVLYVLRFRAFSTTGHDMLVCLHKHGAPYTNYGLEDWQVDLGTSWRTYTREFTAEHFAGKAGDARLRFWLVPFAEAGDQYFIDDVVLVRKDALGKPGVNPGAPDAPRVFALEQNYPNPFNPVTNIGFQIAESRVVRLQVFDVLGREVRTLLHERKEPGVHTTAFDGSDLPSGVYFYRLEAGEYVATKRLVLVK